MKRLIKAYSNALKAPYINSDQALSIIEGSDHECTRDKLIPDNNNMEARWGAVDDTGNYIMEIYLFKCDFALKAAFVFDKIVNDQPSGNLVCIVKEVSGASEAKRMAESGISGIDSEPIAFSNGYKLIEDAPAQNEIDQAN